jgi:hypothetical protein
MEARAMDGIPEETIVSHSRVRATEEAVIIWALASAQYPIDHRIIQGNATVLLIEAVSSFAINARRAIESLAGPSEINLVQPRWQWLPEKESLGRSESSHTCKKARRWLGAYPEQYLRYIRSCHRGTLISGRNGSASACLHRSVCNGTRVSL